MPDNSVPQKGRLSLPAPVLKGEQTYRRKRRVVADVPPEAPVAGLALSGGGIRSATFALGVLQEMARRKILRHIDYLSTVSGGGYIGACLTSLLSRWNVGEELDGPPASPAGRKAKDPLDPEHRSHDWSQGKPGNLEDLLSGAMPLLHRNQVHHLRRHGNFLITRTGAFTREMFRAIGHTVIGLAYTLTLFALAMILLAALHLFLASRLVEGSLWKTVYDGHWPGWKTAISLTGTAWPLASAGALGFLYALIAAWRVPVDPGQEAAGKKEGSGDTGQDKWERGYLRWFAGEAGIVLVAGCILLVEGPRWFGWSWPPILRQGVIESIDTTSVPGIAGSFETLPSVANLLGPLGFSLGMLLAIAFSYGWIGMRERRWTSTRRTLLDGMFGIASYFALGAAVFAATPLFAWYLRAEGVYASLATAATFLISRFLIPSATGPASPGSLSGRFARAAKIIGIQLAIPVLLLLSLILSWLLLAMVHGRMGDPIYFISIFLLVIGFGLMSFFSNFNKVSPHYFYRDRLAEAYLRTDVKIPGLPSDKKKGGLRTVRDDSEMHLRCLHGRMGVPPEAPPATPADPEPSLVDNPSPYHLVVCSLNLAGARDLARRTRKSDVFVFSRLFCGSSTTGWVSTDRYRGGTTRLSRAMTISGAAASPAMGLYTSFAAAFAMVLFNVRLGYWMLNPRTYDNHKDDNDNEVHYPVDDRPPGSEIPKKRTILSDRKDTGIFWPGYLMAEMFGTTSAETKFVNLSDGGHTGDNTGIYPLLQRRCDLIIACDASRDADGTCQDLAEAIRMIDVDENVKVEIDLDDLHPAGEAKHSKAHFAVGRIEYPDCPASGESAKKGWLVYLKPSLTGDEPAAVASYGARTPDFPHETTADQFFDDDQLESYRGLGEHVAGGLFEDGADAAAIVRSCQALWRAT